METTVLWEGMSHEAGRNATVRLYRDRVERVKERSRVSLRRAHQETEVTPLRHITNVQVEKASMRWSKVTVHASGNPVEFQLSHADAAAFREALLPLIL